MKSVPKKTVTFDHCLPTHFEKGFKKQPATQPKKNPLICPPPKSMQTAATKHMFPRNSGKSPPHNCLCWNQTILQHPDWPRCRSCCQSTSRSWTWEPKPAVHSSLHKNPASGTRDGLRHTHVMERGMGKLLQLETSLTVGKFKHETQKCDEGMWVQQQINQRGLVTVKSDSFTQVNDTCLVTSKGVKPLSMLKSHMPPARGGSPVTLEDEASGARGNLLRNSSCFFTRAPCSVVPSGKRFSRTSGHTGWPPWKAKTWRSGTELALPASPSWGRVFGGACGLESQKFHTWLRKAFEMSPKALGWDPSNFLTKPMYLHDDVGSAKRCWTTALPNSNCLQGDATQILRTLQPSNRPSIWQTSGWPKNRNYLIACWNTVTWHEFWHGRACSVEYRTRSGDLLAWCPCPACSWKWFPCAHPLPSWKVLGKPQKKSTSMRSLQNEKHRWTKMRLLFLDRYHPKLSSTCLQHGQQNSRGWPTPNDKHIVALLV